MKSYNKARWILKVLLIFSFTILIGFTLNHNMANASPKENKVTNQSNKKTFYIDSDVVFKGVFSSHSWFFNIEKWWDTDYVEAEIDFSMNQVVQKGVESYLTLSVNDIPFSSEKIAYNPKEETQTLKVKIPKKLFKEGSNKFTVNAYARVTDLPCVDDVNSANWLDIYDSSKVTVNYKNIDSGNDISNFPYPFLKVNDDKNPGTVIVVPDNYTDSDISSALMMNSYLGSIYKNGDYNGKIIKYSDIKDYKDYNIIYIGEENSLPNELKGYFNKVDPGNFKNGSVIKEEQSPYTKTENTKILLLVSNNPDMLNKSIKFMMNDSLVSQINQDQYIVDDNTEELDTISEPSNKITFSELGNDEILLKGPFRRTANLSYYIPKNRVLADGGKIKLNMRYSENLDFDRSLVTVYINGVPIGSKKLTKENANGDSVELNIPSDIKKTSYLNIQVAFDLEMVGVWCEKRSEDTPWALVTGDSYLYLPNSKQLNYYFDNYTNPFVNDGALNNVLIVTPDNMGSDDLTTLGNIVSYWGKDLKYNTGDLMVKKGSEIGDEKEEKNLLIYGTPDNNPFIKEVNDNLWFKYKEGYKSFESNEKLYLTDPFSSQITTYQLSESPFNNQLGMLVLTSPNDKLLRESTEYLSSSEKAFKLTGDSEIIDQYGNVRSFVMSAPKEKPIFEKINDLDGNIKILMGMLALVLILIIAIIIMFTYKYRKLDNKEKKHTVENKIKNILKRK